MKFDDFDALDKEDVWTWEDGDNVRPEQSRRVVADVIQEGKDGNLSRFHQHFLKGFVVPDKDEGEVSFSIILHQISMFNAGNKLFYIPGLRRRSASTGYVQYYSVRTTGIRVREPKVVWKASSSSPRKYGCSKGSDEGP